VDSFIADIQYDLPDYLGKEVPKVMAVGATANIKKYKDILPSGYSLAFDLPTSPASNYVRDLVDLNLSTRDGSTLKTTRDELRRIIADGLDNKGSYGSIAKDIEELDPFVFSKTRAKLISVNEIGRAYGWADSEPARVLSTDYVMEKAWETSNDEKVRPEHAANQAEGWIAIDKSWDGTGDEYAPSQDINCRCTSTDRIIGIKTSDGIIDTKLMSINDILTIARKNHFCNHKTSV
jgi:Phage Mu protein F like protein